MNVRSTIHIALVSLLVAGWGIAQEIPTFEPAKKTSYEQVTRYLNPGGDTYIYQNTTQWGATLEKLLPMVRQVLPSLAGRHGRDEMAVAAVALQIIEKFVTDSGLKALNGVGLSSVPLDGGLHHNRVYVGHTPGKPEGLLWDAFMHENTPLPLLKALPKDTVMAARIPLRGALIWKWVRETIAGLDNEQARREFEQAVEMMGREGVDLDQWLVTLGDGVNIVATLAPKPEGGEAAGGPEAMFMGLVSRLSLAVLVEVKDDTIFNGLDALFKKENAPFLRQDKGAIRMLSFTQRMPIPGFGVAFVQFGNYFGFVSNSAIAEALNEGTGGLAETEEFKRLSAKLPQTGMGFSFLSERLGNEFSATIEQVMQAVQDQQQNRPGMQMASFAMIAMSVAQQLKGQASYAVSVRTDDGALAMNTATMSVAEAMVGKSLFGPYMAMMPVAGMRVQGAQGKAQAISDMSNLKQIGLGVIMYTTDHNERFPMDLGDIFPYINAGNVFVTPGSGTKPPMGAAEIRGGQCDYLYFGAGLQTSRLTTPTTTPVACTKPGLLPGNRMGVLYADGHVEGKVGVPEEIKALIGKAQRQGAVLNKQDVSYARVRGMKVGLHVAETMPEARILLVMPPTPKGGPDEALLAGLKATLGEKAKVVETVTVEPPKEAKDDAWFTGKLLNEQTAKFEGQVDLVISGMGLPAQGIQELWFWQKGVKVALASGDVSALQKAIQAKLVVAAAAVNPTVIPDEWAPPKELDDAFAKRFLLITPESVQAMAQKYPKLFQ